MATTGDYDDLVNTPSLGTAASADADDFATAAQGQTADSAVQPGDLSTVATTGSYNDLIDTPAAPGAPEWGDIGGTLADQADLSGALGAKTDDADLSPVAKTGDYGDLTGTPTIPSTPGEVGADPAGTAAGLVGGLAPVASTGDYGDLINTPSPLDDASDISVDPAEWGGVADNVQDGLDEIVTTFANTLSGLDDVAWSGDYNDLGNTPTLGTAAAADTGDFASAAQGGLADTAVQPGDLSAVATTGSYNDLTDTPVPPETPAGAGLLSERPAPGTLPEGYSYFAVDDLGGTTSTVVDGVWVRHTAAADATTVEGYGNYVSGSVQETLESMDDAHGVTARLDHRMQVIEWDAMIHSAPNQTWDHEDFITPGGLDVVILPDTTIPAVAETRPANDLMLEVSEHSAFGETFGTGAVRVMSKARHHTTSTVDLRCRMRIPAWGTNNPTEVRFGGAGAFFRLTTASTNNKFDVYAHPSNTLIGEIDHFQVHDFRLVGVNGFWQWWLNGALIHSEESTAGAAYSGMYVSLNKTADAIDTESREVVITRLIGAWTV